MRIALFYHSLLSDWNHGNAHFLRGVVSELLSRGHDVRVYEPHNAWSLENLLADHGTRPVSAFHAAYPRLSSTRYRLDSLDLDHVLNECDLAIVHEWNDHQLVARCSAHRKKHDHYRLLFHDTHHRSVSDPESIGHYDLSGFDGVLAFGQIITRIYLDNGWTHRAWTWHEAADTRIFHPQPGVEPEGDLVWIGNWGDGERGQELREYLVEPSRMLGLNAVVYGVRFPEDAIREMQSSGIRIRGWLPNFEVPGVFALFRATVHIPRRPYTRLLPGIPTIRPFEALACGIPLVMSPWEDREGLFVQGKDYLMARSGDEMKRALQYLLGDPERARELAHHGLATIREKHTCAHRVDELMDICTELELPTDSHPAALEKESFMAE